MKCFVLGFLLSSTIANTSLYNNAVVSFVVQDKESKVKTQHRLHHLPLSKPSVPLPNVQLIGIGKCGTTALAQWFFSEGFCGGEVFPSDDEPPHFNKEATFFQEDNRYEKGVEFYMKRYMHCINKNKTIIFDASPNTFAFPQRVYDTYKYFPDLLHQLKIILAIREPISREMSLYNHYFHDFVHNNCTVNSPVSSGCSQVAGWMIPKEDGTPKNISEFIEAYSVKSFKVGSNYALPSPRLKKWFELFDPEQILLLSYELDIKPSFPAKEKIGKFLGYPVETEAPLPASNTKASIDKVTAIPCSDLEKIKNDVERHNKDLYHILNTVKRPSMERSPWVHFTPPTCVQ